MHSDTPTGQPFEASTSPPTLGRRPAGFWIRAAANILDSVVILSASAAMGAAVGVICLFTGSALTLATFGFFLAANLGGVAYLAATESSARQATLGKRAFRLSVSDLAGHRVSFGRALGRAFAKYLNGLTLGLGWILAGVTSRKRGLHDFAAGTVVLRDAGPVAQGWLVAVAVMCALSVPVTGVVAAIAIPALLRASMSGNEARAIDALRAIHAGQQHYRKACGGYAISLTAMEGPPRYLPPHLTTANTVAISGYLIAVTSAPDSTVRDTPEGCRNTVSAYVAQAAPLSRVRGVRYFVMGADGVIYQDVNADLSTGRPIE
jgi:uncharacterized RDD family membrane protein YckC/type II secretory pathway pseudopilin PulG